MDSFNIGSSPRRLETDPFARLSNDLVSHILALVASNGFSFHPKPCLTTDAATSDAATTAAAAAVAVCAAAEANAGGDVSDGAGNNEDDDGLGEKSEDEMFEFIERAVKKPCARFVRVVELTTAIALEAATTAANYDRTMTVPIDQDKPNSPSAAHILASAFLPPPSGARTTSTLLPPPLPCPLPPPPFTVFHHALVCKRWLRLARFSLPAILLQAYRRLSTQTFRSFLSSPPPPSPSSPPLPLSLSLATPTPASASAVSHSFPLHSPLTLQHLHIGPSALDAITDDLLFSIATGCARSLTHMSLYRHRNLRSWQRELRVEYPDDAVATVTEPAVTALFAACRRLVSLKLTLPLCLPELPTSVSLLQRLTRLEVSCGQLDYFSRAVDDGDDDAAAASEPEARFPEGVGSLTAKLPSLQELTIKSCSSLSALLPSFSALSSLTALTVYHCTALASLPEDIGDVPRLASLVLDKLSSLTAIPDSLVLLSSLTYLHAAGSMVLASLPASFEGMNSLTRLQLLECSLSSLPEDFGQLSALTELHLNKVACDLPGSFVQLRKLRRLIVDRCAPPLPTPSHPSAASSSSKTPPSPPSLQVSTSSPPCSTSKSATVSTSPDFPRTTRPRPSHPPCKP
ncbi:unnamed protein product [Closterium sp. NIES-65]|nr:unnamed protein product [Closterium sp. NIES-65]